MPRCADCSGQFLVSIKHVFAIRHQIPQLVDASEAIRREITLTAILLRPRIHLGDLADFSTSAALGKRGLKPWRSSSHISVAGDAAKPPPALRASQEGRDVRGRRNRGNHESYFTKIAARHQTRAAGAHARNHGNPAAPGRRLARTADRSLKSAQNPFCDSKAGTETALCTLACPEIRPSRSSRSAGLQV